MDRWEGNKEVERLGLDFLEIEGQPRFLLELRVRMEMMSTFVKSKEIVFRYRV